MLQSRLKESSKIKRYNMAQKKGIKMRLSYDFLEPIKNALTAQIFDGAYQFKN